VSDNPILDLERELLAAHDRLTRSEPALATATEQPEVPVRRWSGGAGRRRFGVLAVVLVLAAAAGAAAATFALTGERSRPQSGALPHGFATGPVPSSGYRVELAPDLMAGAAASWCTTFEFLADTKAASFGSSGCVGRDGPVAAPGGASGLGPGDHWVLYAVLTPEVAAVRISGTPRLLIPVTGPGLPYGWKVAVAIARSTRSFVLPGPNGTHQRLYPPPTMTFLDARRRQIRVASHPSVTRLPVRSIDPSRPPRGSCTIRSRSLPGLRAISESTLRTSAPQAVETAEPGYLSCASVELRYHRLPVIGAILLDARHPGRRPPPLPGTHPLRGDPDTYVGPGAEEVGFMRFGFDETAALIAKRIGNAWLVVQGPHSLNERQAILASLTARP
jgi:hypothetical protein